MALDKLVDSTQLDADLTSVANAIRAKSGGSSQLAFPAGFVSEISNIPSGGGIVLTKIGETPEMNDNNNSSNDNLCTVDVDGLAFDAILFRSRDKTAYKIVPYFTDTIQNTNNGPLVFPVSSTQVIKYTAITISFGIRPRDSAEVKTLTICHQRMTSRSGDFYMRHPQVFDIYAMSYNPAEW